MGIRALRKAAMLRWTFKADLRQIGHGVGGLHEFLQRGHYSGAGEEFAEEVDFAAKFFVRDGLDEFFCGRACVGVELCNLAGGGASDLDGFALGCELRD
jgi:hypothetical protein